MDATLQTTDIQKRNPVAAKARMRDSMGCTVTKTFLQLGRKTWRVGQLAALLSIFAWSFGCEEMMEEVRDTEVLSSEAETGEPSEIESPDTDDPDSQPQATDNAVPDFRDGFEVPVSSLQMDSEYFSPRSASTTSEYSVSSVYEDPHGMPKYNLCAGVEAGSPLCSRGKYWWEYNVSKVTMELWKSDGSTASRFFTVNMNPSKTSVGTVGLGKGINSYPGDSAVNIYSTIDNNGTRAALQIVRGSGKMLLDDNEIDAIGALYLQNNTQKNVILNNNGGRVGIGMNHPQYLLDVDGDANVRGSFRGTLRADLLDVDGDASIRGTLRAEEIILDSNWSDYVFKDDYQLLTLDEVESFIAKNGHLPNVPSEKTVQKDGISVGASDAKLLEKIEELTLYVIEQHKQLKQQKEEISNLKKLVSDNSMMSSRGRHD